MAGRDELERVAGKAILDAGFRQRLLSDPQAAASSIGVTLSREQVGYVQQLDSGAVAGLATSLEDKIKDMPEAPPLVMWGGG